MKQLLLIIGLLAVLSFILMQLQQRVVAVTVGVEPPGAFMHALKTCTKGTFTDKQNARVTEYSIKRLLPNGRCEYTITETNDFSDKKDYETAKLFANGFLDMATSMAKQNNQEVPKDLPSADDMLKLAEQEKQVTVCKLSKQERDDLYKAWSMHDDKNPPPKVSKDGVSFTFDSSKMSSYSNLMIKYSQGPCTETDNDSAKQPEKTYACEYSDTTCYWKDFGNGASTMSCSKENPNVAAFKLMDKVKEHVKKGMCSLI
jgi:hypothetical protein